MAASVYQQVRRKSVWEELGLFSLRGVGGDDAIGCCLDAGDGAFLQPGGGAPWPQARLVARRRVETLLATAAGDRLALKDLAAASAAASAAAAATGRRRVALAYACETHSTRDAATREEAGEEFERRTQEPKAGATAAARVAAEAEAFAASAAAAAAREAHLADRKSVV